MLTQDEVLALLPELDQVTAEDLEDQTLDFKADPGSIKELLRVIYEGVVCFANTRGGTLVIGVNDKVKTPGRAQAITGLVSQINLDEVQRQIYDTTDPHVSAHLELLSVPEGTLLLVHIPPHTPPVTSSQVRTTRRVGRNCMPFGGSAIRTYLEQVEATDLSARTIAGLPPSDLLSAAEMERLREFGSQNKAPADLLALPNPDLLTSLGLIREGELTLAGVLLVGKKEAIRKHIPTHEWQYAKMRSDTDIDVRDGGYDPLLNALDKLETQIRAANPIVTIEQGFFHTEFRTYPEIALREAILNAFVHRDYAMPGPTLIQLYPNRLEIKNLGGLIGGITPENILNHPPVHRNRALADALEGIGLVNRKNLGVKRIFQSLLREGKEPPSYWPQLKALTVTFFAHSLDLGFLSLVAWVNQRFNGSQRMLSANELLVLHHLKRHREADLAILTQAAQLTPDSAKELLSGLEALGAIEHGGLGKGTYYRLTRAAMDQLGDSLGYDRDKRLEWEAVKTRILMVLQDRPLSNAEVREICSLDRQSVKRLMSELRSEGLVGLSKRGRWAKWYKNGTN